jgi:hypothetical protein
MLIRLQVLDWCRGGGGYWAVVGEYWNQVARGVCCEDLGDF